MSDGILRPVGGDFYFSILQRAKPIRIYFNIQTMGVVVTNRLFSSEYETAEPTFVRELKGEGFLCERQKCGEGCQNELFSTLVDRLLKSTIMGVKIVC